MCGNRHVVFLPTDKLSEPRLPPYPHRVRAFVYGCAIGLNEMESDSPRSRQSRRRSQRQGVR